MIKNKAREFVYFKYTNLSKFKNINHFVTTRIGGQSSIPYQSSNMSFLVGDNDKNVTNNRVNFLNEIDVPSRVCVFADLSHSANIKILNNIPKITVNGFHTVKNVDAIISCIPNICLLVTAADCIPITVFDRRKKVIGIVHAGWRGSVAEISSKVIGVMKNNFDSNPKDIFVGLGPSICGKDYEVGQDVIKNLNDEYAGNVKIVKQINDKWYLDLENLNISQFIKAGVPNRNIETSGFCTYENNSLFYSNRKENPTGRFMSGIILKHE